MTDSHETTSPDPESPLSPDDRRAEASPRPTPPDPALWDRPKKGPIGELFAPVAGYGVTISSMFRKVATEQYPEQKVPTAPPVSRTPPAQPVRRRLGALHRLRAVRLGVPGGRDPRRGRS